VDRQLDALGDGTRRAIFERIAREPLAVVDIARELPVSRPAVSQHLKVLKDAGLVTDRAEGARRVYHIDPRGLAVLRAYFDGFWSGALDAFRQSAEAPDASAEEAPQAKTWGSAEARAPAARGVSRAKSRRREKANQREKGRATENSHKERSK
jgi:DNA-binding transcriptional ArsR family regulator